MDCGVPEFPSGGSASEVTRTTEGATVSFQCEGRLLLPSGSNSIVIICTTANDIGEWMPDPSDQQCRRPGILSTDGRLKMCGQIEPVIMVQPIGITFQQSTDLTEDMVTCPKCPMFH